MGGRRGAGSSSERRRLQAAGQREFVRGALEMAILALIGSRSTYGYEVLSRLRESTDGSLNAKEGTVYPLLHRLEDSGYVSGSWKAEGRAAPRKYYAITGAGRQRLASLRAEWDRLTTGMSRLFEGSR
jgi:PadR family transcriptional regulator PadR